MYTYTYTYTYIHINVDKYFYTHTYVYAYIGAIQRRNAAPSNKRSELFCRVRRENHRHETQERRLRLRNSYPCQNGHGLAGFFTALHGAVPVSCRETARSCHVTKRRCITWTWRLGTNCIITAQALHLTSKLRRTAYTRVWQTDTRSQRKYYI